MSPCNRISTCIRGSNTPKKTSSSRTCRSAPTIPDLLLWIIAGITSFFSEVSLGMDSHPPLATPCREMGGMARTARRLPMSHLEVVRAYIRGQYRRGSRVFADESDGAAFSYGRHFPLIIEIPGGFLVNGSRYSVSTARHQSLALRALAESRQRYAVVPFNAIERAMAALNHRVPISFLSELKEMVSSTIPSSGERWRSVEYMKPDGTVAHRSVHTLGDSVIRVGNHDFVSAVDETGVGRGIYFFTQLPSRKTPSSLQEALDMLKPPFVRNAEKEGLEVRRQGEWFAVPVRTRTRQLMRDVRRGVAVHGQDHVLGRDGHHRLKHSVIYKYGPKKGQVFARGSMRHTRGEHRMLALPEWSRIVHSVQGRSYSLSGNFD